MNEKIKIDGNSIQIGNKVCYCVDKDLLDYIVKLQQDLDKSNDIIEKDRQFYKCRMDEYVDYKSRCKKAIELYKNCKEEDYCILSLNMYEVLNGSDENE